MAEPRRVVLATTNPHKVEEFRAIYADLPVTLVTPTDLGLCVSVDETGATFEQNAVLKALAFAEATDPICGMSVDVATARYTSERDGQTYYFCCAGCKTTFDAS